MKTVSVILDTGPLVAYLNQSDRYHEWVVDQYAALRPPFYTCEAVLSEACFLLRHYEKGIGGVFQLLKRGLLQIPFRLQDEISAISRLMTKYKNIPMSLADACLVRMTEQMVGSNVCTLDSDFNIYRKNRRQTIPTMMPEDLKRSQVRF